MTPGVIPGLSERSCRELQSHGFTGIDDFSGIHFPDLYKFLGFDQAKKLLTYLRANGISVKFDAPDWTESQWRQLDSLIVDGILTWGEVAMAVCGELNPPQVGTAIASKKSFQTNYPPRKTMQAVMEWFYNLNGKCAVCGTRLFLEADHITSKQAHLEAGSSVDEADALGNMQLLCKRCNVIKRPSHKLGGVSFAPAQAVLIWILLHHKPPDKKAFYSLCRSHGLTMANIPFDEAWAFAEWLSREGKYQIR
jgi:hypothetical protein